MNMGELLKDVAESCDWCGGQITDGGLCSDRGRNGVVCDRDCYYKYHEDLYIRVSAWSAARGFNPCDGTHADWEGFDEYMTGVEQERVRRGTRTGDERKQVEDDETNA